MLLTTQTIQTAAIATFLLTLLTLIYRITLHPLSKYPGPPLAQISGTWKLIGDLKKRKAHRIHVAHLKYGPIIRIAPNELSFSSPASAKEIYTSSNFRKEETFYFSKRIYHENHLLSFRDNEAHRQRKKLLQRGFSAGSLQEFEPVMSSKIQCLLDQTGQAKQPVDIYPWVYWLGFDTIYHLMFDSDPGCLQAGKSHWVMACMAAWRPIYIYKGMWSGMEKYGVYVPGFVGGYFRAVRRWKEFAVGVIRKCRAKGTKTPFLSLALEGVDEALGRRLRDEELAEECMGGMFGGTGTTANTFIYVLWAVLRDERVLGKLREELDGAFDDRKAVPEGAECAKLEYLQAVINETLRRYPTIIATLPRVAVMDCEVQGIMIPKGTIVAAQSYTLHRDEEAFPDAESFIPERWLDKEGDAARKDAFVAFSYGPRSCIGINLARMELSKVTAAFFLRFKARLDESMEEEDMEQIDQFSSSPVGAKMSIWVEER